MMCQRKNILNRCGKIDLSFSCSSFKKLKRYQEIGFIKDPVRALIDVDDATKFSIQTGRHVILRLTFLILYWRKGIELKER